MLKILPISVALLLSISGCSQKSSSDVVVVDDNKVKDGFKKCEDPRSQVYMTDIELVCAKTVTGSYTTVSNGGAACANKDIVGYTKGSCDADKKSYIIMFKKGVDADKEIEKLKSRYKIKVKSRFKSINGFSTRIDRQALEGLMFEKDISKNIISIEEDRVIKVNKK